MANPINTRFDTTPSKCAFDETKALELLSFASASRGGVYTQSCIDCVAEVILDVWQPDKIRGLELTYQTSLLRRFTARFCRLNP